mmetsp:Transcript_27511/g.65411  ORF Transcript_27511/g.65411 Transcript_27511/m.65411 type:complete len:477 (-) Transcript_27511:1298-2728(-)
MYKLLPPTKNNTKTAPKPSKPTNLYNRSLAELPSSHGCRSPRDSSATSPRRAGRSPAGPPGGGKGFFPRSCGQSQGPQSALRPAPRRPASLRPSLPPHLPAPSASVAWRPAPCGRKAASSSCSCNPTTCPRRLPSPRTRPPLLRRRRRPAFPPSGPSPPAAPAGRRSSRSRRRGRRARPRPSRPAWTRRRTARVPRRGPARRRRRRTRTSSPRGCRPCPATGWRARGRRRPRSREEGAPSSSSGDPSPRAPPVRRPGSRTAPSAGGWVSPPPNRVPRRTSSRPRRRGTAAPPSRRTWRRSRRRSSGSRAGPPPARTAWAGWGARTTPGASGARRRAWRPRRPRSCTGRARSRTRRSRGESTSRCRRCRAGPSGTDSPPHPVRSCWRRGRPRDPSGGRSRPPRPTRSEDRAPGRSARLLVPPIRRRPTGRRSRRESARPCSRSRPCEAGRSRPRPTSSRSAGAGRRRCARRRPGRAA